MRKKINCLEAKNSRNNRLKEMKNKLSNKRIIIR